MVAPLLMVAVAPTRAATPLTILFGELLRCFDRRRSFAGSQPAYGGRAYYTGQHVADPAFEHSLGASEDARFDLRGILVEE